MIKKRKFPKIFFGWWTVLASGILALWGYGYQAYGISALFKPIASELGFNRAVTSVAASIGRFGGGIESPLSGWITDRFGPKWIVLFGVFLSALGLILMNYINSLWAYYVVWGVVLGTGINIALGVPLDTAIANWFVKKRGLALSVKWVFSGLSGVLVLPLVAWLIIVQGWRMTCVIGGLVMGLVGFPLAWFCLKQRRPEYYGLLPDGAANEEEITETEQMIDKGVEYASEIQEVEFTIRQALKTPAYWLLIIIGGIHNLVSPVMSIHCIPFLTDRGIEPLKAAAIMAVMISASIPSRLIGGLISDRVSVKRLRFLLAGAYLLQSVGIAVFLLNQTEVMIYIWFILYGFGMGAGYIIEPMIRARYFGRKAFGSIEGSSMMFLTPIGVLAPVYAGWIYDTTGSYMIAFNLFAVLLGISAVLMAFVWPPKPPTQLTDVGKIV
ncbi:MFS transporter [Chloroflexota bacterium]